LPHTMPVTIRTMAAAATTVALRIRGSLPVGGVVPHTRRLLRRGGRRSGSTLLQNFWAPLGCSVVELTAE
jgi:hypothetical protein